MQTGVRELAEAQNLDQGLLFKQLVEHMNESIWVIDKEQHTLYVNPQFCRLTGFSFEELVGFPAYDLLDDLSRKWVMRIDEVERAHGVSSTYEVVLRSKTREQIPVLISGAPLANGETVAIITDLRNRNLANTSSVSIEEDSEHSISSNLNQEFLFQRLVEYMNEAVWVIDANHETIYVNPRFSKMMGCSIEEMLGKKSYAFFDEKSRNRVRQVDKTHRAKGLSTSYEAVMVTKSGEHIPVLISGAPLNNGSTVGIITDLSDLRRREDRERMHTMAMSYASDGILVVSEQGIIESWNKGARAIFGYSKNEAVGQQLSLIFDEINSEEILDREKIQYRLEMSGKHQSGLRLLASITINPLPADSISNREPMFLLVIRDITSERKVEEDLTIKYQKMREAYNELGVVRRQLDYVFELMETSQKYDNSRPVADFVVNSLTMLTKADACVLRIYNPKTDLLEHLSSFGVGEKWRSKATIPFKDGLPEKAFKKGAPLKIIDLAKEPKYTSLNMARAHGFSSLLIVPLVFRTRFVGCLSIYVTPEKKLEIFDNEFIEQYAKAASVALSNWVE